MVPLEYVFRNGDVAEIITSSRPDARPSLDWLSFVASSPARSKIKAWYRRAQRDESIARGRERLEQECSRLGIDPETTLADKALSALAPRLSYSSVEDIYAAVGYGDLAPETVLRRLRGERPRTKRKKRSARADQGALRVAISAGGVTDVLFRLSRCCAPVPGDPIVGFITRGRGVTVHRADCSNVAYYSRREPDRLVPLEWTLSAEAYFPVTVEVDALDRVGLTSDITSIISSLATNILEARVRTGGKPKMARISLRIEVKSLDHLKQITDRIGALSDVLRVERARRG
jgi:guanosine-3',5'-bis(diphosphate) 3'-pyrophosphohydrolase